MNQKELQVLQEKIGTLQTKLNISQRLIHAIGLVNSTLDLSTVLDMLMSLACQLVNAEASSILLLDEEKGQLYFAAATGKKKEEVRKIYLDRGEGIAGWVAEHGQPMFVPDVSKDARFSSKVDKLSGFKTQSILAVPLKIENKLIGVAEVVNKKDSGNFGPDDLELLQTLSTTGALAIQKAHLYQDLNDLFIGTVRAIADAVEAKDPYTRGHCERMRKFSLVIAEGLNLTEKEMKDIELAALLHDVGKIGVPEKILLKESKLTDEEWQTIKKHPVIGAEILSGIKQLHSALPGVRYHHERYDGKGYPEGLNAEKIPLVARILAVTDAYDAMTSTRPYREACPEEKANQELIRLKGIQFDPKCVDIFLQSKNTER